MNTQTSKGVLRIALMVSKNDRTMTSVFIILLFHTDANTDEVLEMKVFNPNFRASDKEIYKMLEKANLTGRGYKKEVTTRVVQGESGKTDYQASDLVCLYVRL